MTPDSNAAVPRLNGLGHQNARRARPRAHRPPKHYRFKVES